MEHTTVPREAAIWIAAKIGGNPMKYTEMPGLMYLKVSQLHIIYGLLRRIPEVHLVNKRLRGKKDEVAAAIARIFYNDFVRERGVNARLMDVLLNDSLQRSNEATAQAQFPTPSRAHVQTWGSNQPSSLPSSPSPDFMNPNYWQQRISQQMGIPMAISTTPGAAAHTTPLPVSNRGTQTSPFARLPSQPPSNLQQHSSQRPSSASGSLKRKRVTIKTERDYDGSIPSSTPRSHERPHQPAETHPRTPQEESVTGQLVQMGFTNRREILTRYRAMSSGDPTSPPPSVDEVMLALVTAREEAEEARKMDEARLQSERTRKQEAAALRAANERRFQERLEEASLHELPSNPDFFPRSWILAKVLQTLQQAGIGNFGRGKQKLLRLLKLEKRARQWYGKDLPKAYFVVEVCDRIKNCNHLSESAMGRILEKESDSLERGMYTLKEQTGGVPKVLLVAHEQHGKRLRSEEDSDDDEIEVVEVRTTPTPAKPAASKATSARLKSGQPEIIEIL